MFIFNGLQCVASGSSLWLGIISSGSVDRMIFCLCLNLPPLRVDSIAVLNNTVL